MESSEQFLDRAMKYLQRSDPIPKLLPQVRIGRMPKDSPSLIAILEGWLDAYIQVLKDGQPILDVFGVLRLDPNPRLAVLFEAGVLSADHPHVKSLRETWDSVLDAAEKK